MSQLAQNSTYQHANYNFIKTHHIEMYNITQNNPKGKVSSLRHQFHSNLTIIKTSKFTYLQELTKNHETSITSHTYIFQNND